MLDNLIYCLNGTIPIFLLMLLGVLFRKMGFFSQAFADKLNSYVFKVGLPIMIVVSVSMAVVVVLSKTIGCLLPIGAKVLHLDPAMMAGPLISTLVDAIALIFYFNIATLLLQPFA